MQSNRTQFENRAIIAIAALGVALSLLDLLSIMPGAAAKFTPLMIGVVLLYLVAQRSQLDGLKFILRRLQRVTDDLKADSRRNHRQQIASQPSAGKKNVASRPETYREIKWKGLTFRSHSELKIARSLDHAGVLFLSSCKVRLKTEHGRQSREVDFLVCHKGRWAILEVDGPHHSAAADGWRDGRFQEHGIQVFRFDAKRCYQQPRQVVQEFLSRLDNIPLVAANGSKEVFVVEFLDPKDVERQGSS
jgi:very-short-patch-repair endonuclease